MSEMDRDEFDEVLGKALRRVDAPEGFAARVMEQAAVRPRAKVLVFPRLPVWATGAVAAALIVGALSVGEVHERRARVEARRVEAEREFETASQITDKTLEHAREQLARAGVKLGE